MLRWCGGLECGMLAAKEAFIGQVGGLITTDNTDKVFQVPL